jgi:aspartyl/asparaginyl beta-hydroxylase (cupin superfamily)
MMRVTLAFLLSLSLLPLASGFFVNTNGQDRALHVLSGKGFGASPERKEPKKGKQSSRLVDSLEDKESIKPKSVKKPLVNSEQEDLLASLASASSRTCLGKAVASSPLSGTPDADPFWELMPSLIGSRFPKIADHELERVAGFVRHALDPNLPLEDSIIQDPYRPHDEIHAYMPGLGSTTPFRDPNELQLCQLLSENYETIRQEYDALIQDMESGSGKDRFQSVTSMNYEGGWRTLVLFYNGHRIPKFPYHLCPTTTKIMETVPLAGRIAGFNRQQPETGIPLHTDGNNMWLTCQMGVYVPEGEKAYIRVGPETRRWKMGECLVYDTTYEHETMNEHPTQERVVLHVDLFNTLTMTPVEIEVMEYIYKLREAFMKAEGVAKVGAQIL